MKKLITLATVALIGAFPAASMAHVHHKKHKKHKKHHVTVVVAPKPVPPAPKPAATPPPPPNPAPAPQSQGPLSTSAAGNAALNYAMNNWPSRLPSYSMASGFDHVSGNSCLVFGTYSVHCVVSVDNSDYYFDPYADTMAGYAYCVGTLDVAKNQWSGALSVTDEGITSCDSTYDY